MAKSIVWLAILTMVLGIGVTARADDSDDGDADVEYCGGGPPSKVDEAQEQLDEGDVDAAKQTITSALQQGEVSGWERAPALALLGTIELKQHRPAAALRNFRRALAVVSQSPDGDDGSAEGAGALHVEIATALYFLGRNAQALAEARGYVRDSCGAADGVEQIDPISCYGAQYLISLATTDSTEMFEAMNAADAIRRASSDYAASAFDSYVAMFQPSHASGTEVASASTPATAL